MSAEEYKVMSENLFIGGSDMGALMRAYDWAQTSLGSVENWSESLKTTISILLNAPYPMFLVWQGKSDARLLFYNDASASVFDKSGDLIPLGQSISQDWAKGWGKLRSHIEQVFTTGQPLRHENEQIPHDQDDNFGGRSYTWSYTPICDETGQVSGVLVTGYKVLSENIQPALSNQSFDSIKEKLQRREEQLSLITNALPVLIAYIDKNHYYQFNNQTYETWFGQAAANLTGKHVREVLGESAYEVVRPYMEQALSGQHVTFESHLSPNLGKMALSEAITH
jgi:PAS domain-containing protein